MIFAIQSLLQALGQVQLENNDAGPLEVQQLLMYRNNYRVPSFIRVVYENRHLISSCFKALSSERKTQFRTAYEALMLYAQEYHNAPYKEHVLQKYVVEGNVTGVCVGVELGVNINTQIGYLPDIQHSLLFQGFVQLFSFQWPTAWTSNSHRATPLILASMLGHYDIVRLLVLSGSQLNTETHHGNIALDWATRRGYSRIENFLVDKGALRHTTTGSEVDALEDFGVLT